MTIRSSSTILAALLTFAPLSSAQRDFTSTEGKTLRAEIVNASESDVTLRREKDGKDFTIPLARLSEDDQDFVEAWFAKKKLNTRPTRQLTLQLEGGKTEIVEVPKGEYLTKEGTLTLYPGDTIHLEFDEAGTPHIAGEEKDPKRTVTFSMTQDAQITMLTRKTKMRETVAMDCTHRGLGTETFARTNLRPTEKGLAAFDSWPGTVWTLRLSNFEVTDRSASEVYQERVSN